MYVHIHILIYIYIYTHTLILFIYTIRILYIGAMSEAVRYQVRFWGEDLKEGDVLVRYIYIHLHLDCNIFCTYCAYMCMFKY